MTDALKDFIERARAVSFDRALGLVGVDAPERGEYQGPCPQCGGDDRFSVNRAKGVWNCRQCGGGRDGISLVAHSQRLPRKGYGFLEACSLLLGEDIPKGGERETAEQKAEREARIAEDRARFTRDRDDGRKKDNPFRDRDIRKARGMWQNAVDCLGSTDAAHEGHRIISAYMFARSGFWMPGGLFENARFLAACGYYRGEDRAGRSLCIHSGPAMVLPFVDPSGRVVGSHRTWFDLKRPEAKYRPVLWGVSKEGKKAGLKDWDEPTEAGIAAGHFERLPTKKMLGEKKGAMIPLCGDPSAGRWVVGEGIENVMAWCCAEGVRADTFYCSAGDLGNLSGPRDRESDFFHPEILDEDARGRKRRRNVPGPVPDPQQTAEDALQVPDHVAFVGLVADGDSEPYFTASAMARAEARLGRDGRTIETWWPPRGTDWAKAILEAMREGDDA